MTATLSKRSRHETPRTLSRAEVRRQRASIRDCVDAARWLDLCTRLADGPGAAVRVRAPIGRVRRQLLPLCRHYGFDVRLSLCEPGRVRCRRTVP